jgi:hypothetical protein
MIETCVYCRKRHETEPDGKQELYGMQYKVCPEMPKDELIAIDPRATMFGEPAITRLENIKSLR